MFYLPCITFVINGLRAQGHVFLQKWQDSVAAGGENFENAASQAIFAQLQKQKCIPKNCSIVAGPGPL